MPGKIQAPPQKWSTANATSIIREIASHPEMDLILTRHASDQMLARDLLVGDVRYVLKNGFVLNNPNESTRPGYYKYEMEGRSPNSGNRTVRVVAIPDPGTLHMKVITVMWVDE